MLEFHAWLGLSDSPFEEDHAVVAAVVKDIQASIDALPEWPAARYRVDQLNGHFYLSMHGLLNRRTAEAEFMESLLSLVSERLPGSWGMVHERDDEMPEPVGPNSFRIRVMTRGVLREHDDPFLSPINPVIED
jgi:hypothetical protein